MIINWRNVAIGSAVLIAATGVWQYYSNRGKNSPSCK